MKLDESIGLTYFDVDKTRAIGREIAPIIDSRSETDELYSSSNSSMMMTGRSEFSTPTDWASHLL